MHSRVMQSGPLFSFFGSLGFVDMLFHPNKFLPEPHETRTARLYWPLLPRSFPPVRFFFSGPIPAVFSAATDVPCPLTLYGIRTPSFSMVFFDFSAPLSGDSKPFPGVFFPTFEYRSNLFFIFQVPPTFIHTPHFLPQLMGVHFSTARA